MNPTETEKNTARTCKLISYVFSELGKEVPEWVKLGAEIERPRLVNGCYTYSMPEKLDEAVRLLCKTVRGLKDDDLERIVYNGRNKMSRDLADFWEEHLEADKKREEREAFDREQDEIEFERLKKKLGK